MMSPLADMEHQMFQMKLATIFQTVLGWDSQALVLAGANVADQERDWQHNYRCPDVLAYLPGTTAQNRGTHSLGGPDIAVEILSKHDHAREKLPFYAKVNVQELILIDRNPWSFEFFRLDPSSKSLVLAGQSNPRQPRDVASQILPLSFSLTPGPSRPTLLVTQHDSPARWNI